MPAGKELGTFDGKFTSIRVREISGEDRVIEGTYEAEISGELGGTATGTITFSGPNDRGTTSDLGVGYLNTGVALSARGQGIYFLVEPGNWEYRAAYLLGDQAVVSEGQITMANGVFSLKGTIWELT